MKLPVYLMDKSVRHGKVIPICDAEGAVVCMVFKFNQDDDEHERTAESIRDHLNREGK